MTQRVLGSVAASTEGATVVGIGGLHGNEPAGVRALESVLRDLRREGRGLNRGEFVALSGNRPALRAGVRFLDRDLNRIWTETPPVDDIEGREQADLSKILYAIREEDSGPIHLVDLHTASGDAPPFAVLGDTPANREFGLALPVPLVLGLPNEIHGTLLEYLDGRGWASVGFESGSHRGADSMSMAASALWLLLGSLELLGSRDARVRDARSELEAAAEGFPRAVEVFHHHPLVPDADFRMLPGFRSFQPVREGELLARQGSEEIRAPRAGRLLMPLYQPRGGEGFFLTRTVTPDPSAGGSPGPEAI